MTGDPRHMDELEKIYRTVTQDSLMKPNFCLSEINYWDLILGRKSHLFDHDSIYDTKPLRELIDTYVAQSDWDLLGSKDGVEIGFPIVSLDTGKGEVVSNLAYPDADLLREAVMASASVPVLMPPVTVFPDRGKFVDGCFVAYNPIDVLHHSQVLERIEHVFAISTEDYEFSTTTMLSDVLSAIADKAGMGSEEHIRRVLRIVRWLTHKKPLIPKLIWDVLDEEKVIAMLEHALDELVKWDVKTVHPNKAIEMNPFSFSQPEMSKLVDKGIKDAKKQVPEILLNA